MWVSGLGFRFPGLGFNGFLVSLGGFRVWGSCSAFVFFFWWGFGVAGSCSVLFLLVGLWGCGILLGLFLQSAIRGVAARVITREPEC